MTTSSIIKTQGAPGASGFSGYSGLGLSGFSGAQGASGFSGIDGGVGSSGFSGYSGSTGSNGSSGFSGYSGTQGSSGFSGVDGSAGTSGFSGYSGVGTSGFSGYSSVGSSGFSGYSGAMPSGDISLSNNTLSGLKNATYNGEYDAGNTGTSITITWTNGQNQKATLTGSPTITLGSPPAVGHYQLRLIQNGANAYTVTWAGTPYSASRWLGSAAAPAVNTASNGQTIINFFYDGTNLYQSLAKVGAA